MRAWLLPLLLLVACEPLPVADPASLRATAQALEALAGRAERHLAATRTAQEYALQATAQAQAAQATAQALEAQATAQALRLEREAFQATATAQALQQEAASRERQRQRQEQAATLRLILALAFLAGLGGIALALLWQAGQRWLAWQERRQALIESRAGTLLLLPSEAHPLRVEVIPPALPVPPAAGELETETASIPYHVNGRLVGFLQRPQALEAERRLALRLLRQAIQQAGPHSQRLPGWRELGWSAETWTQAVRLLGEYLDTQPGKGTFLVGEYPTLQDLYFAVGERKASLSPAPQEGV